MKRLILSKIALIFFLVNLIFIRLIFVQAADLTDFSVALGEAKPNISTSYTIDFKISTTGTIKKFNFYFTRAVDNPNKPAALDLGDATLASTTGLTINYWDLDKSAASNGTFSISAVDGETKASGDQISITFNNIHTPELGNCTVANPTIYDECYLSLSTYSDNGETLVDSGGSVYRIEDTPSLSFTIEGVTAGTWTNGMITSKSTEYNEVDFGVLEIKEPESAAQRLIVSTTAPQGYEVSMKLDGYIQGLYPNNKIDPFAAYNAAWSSPQEWETPIGSTPNSDSGWIGANTSDTRVPNWNSAASKFGPVSSTAHTVMYSSTRDRSGTSVYITYAMEVNQFQPPDSYSGKILYSIVTAY